MQRGWGATGRPSASELPAWHSKSTDAPSPGRCGLHRVDPHPPRASLLKRPAEAPAAFSRHELRCSGHVNAAPSTHASPRARPPTWLYSHRESTAGSRWAPTSRCPSGGAGSCSSSWCTAPPSACSPARRVCRQQAHLPGPLPARLPARPSRQPSKPCQSVALGSPTPVPAAPGVLRRPRRVPRRLAWARQQLAAHAGAAQPRRGV